METQTFADRTLSCTQCGEDFVFSVADQRFFETHGYTEPRHCLPCRRAIRLLREQANPGIETRTCRDCSRDFGLTAEDRTWFVARKLRMPSRCRACRQKRRVRREGYDDV